MNLDDAIFRALPRGTNKAKTSIASHGGSGFSSTAKISTVLSDGTERQFFVKTGTGRDASVMFAGEHESLNALQAVEGLCPASIAHGPLDSSPNTHFLLTDFLDMRSRSSTSTSSSTPPPPSLATKLARLHTTPAPTPPGHSSPQYGFPVPTCCGSTQQDNTFSPDWADFYAERRLRPIWRASQASNGPDRAMDTLLERVVTEVVPRLLRSGHLGGAKGIVPVVVHGDLWSGNRASSAIILGGGGGGQGPGPSPGPGPAQEVVFDPSSTYAHSEYELGIMRMFGGFGGAFFHDYHSLCPKTEPAEEYEDRVRLYELYHQLNHYALFGGSYRGGAVGIMRELCRKYGRGE